MLGLLKKKCDIKDCEEEAVWLVVSKNGDKWVYCDEHFKKSRKIFKKGNFTDTIDEIAYVVNLSSDLRVLAELNQYILMEMIRNATDNITYNISKTLLEVLLSRLGGENNG